jgi:hypothetical protein
MLIYALIVFAGMASALLSAAAGGDRRPLYAGCALLTAFAFLRGDVGTDTYTYHQQYFDFAAVDTDILRMLAIEPFFLLLIKLLAAVGSLTGLRPEALSTAFVGMIALFQGWLLMLLLRRLRDPGLFLLFYSATFYVNFQFNILRAATATLLLCLSVLLLDTPADRRKGFVVLLLTPAVHYGAVLLVPWVLAYDALRTGRYLRFALVAITAATVAGAVLALAMSQPFFEIMAHKYTTYLQDQSTTAGIGFVLNMAMLVLVAVFALGYDKADLFFFAIPVLALRVLALSLPAADRVVDMLYPMMALAIAQRTRRTVYAPVTLLLLLLSTMNAISTVAGLPNSDTQGAQQQYRLSPYLPYRTFLDQP